MKNKINIIKEIYFAKVSEVSSYTQSTSVLGNVKIDTSNWQKIDKSPAPSTFSIRESVTTAGRQYASEISIALKEPLIVQEPVILKVEFCDSETIIVGSVELPVQIESSIQLISKKLDISYKSWHYPLILI